MTKWQITNTTSGVDLGIYEGETREDALNAMACDAGYKSFADSCETTSEDGSDLRVVEIATVTDEQIKALRREAGEAGDEKQVAICDRALNGDDNARTECARVIADAVAQA